MVTRLKKITKNGKPTPPPSPVPERPPKCDVDAKVGCQYRRKTGTLNEIHEMVLQEEEKKKDDSRSALSSSSASLSLQALRVRGCSK